MTAKSPTLTSVAHAVAAVHASVKDLLARKDAAERALREERAEHEKFRVTLAGIVQTEQSWRIQAEKDAAAWEAKFQEEHALVEKWIADCLAWKAKAEAAYGPSVLPAWMKDELCLKLKDAEDRETLYRAWVQKEFEDRRAHAEEQVRQVRAEEQAKVQAAEARAKSSHDQGVIGWTRCDALKQANISMSIERAEQRDQIKSLEAEVARLNAALIGWGAWLAATRTDVAELLNPPLAALDPQLLADCVDDLGAVLKDRRESLEPKPSPTYPK